MRKFRSLHRRVAWIPSSHNPDSPSARIRCFDILPLLQGSISAEIFKPLRKYDIVVLQKKCSEAHLLSARALQKLGTRIIFDLCDNNFYNPDNNAQQSADATRLKRMVQIADLLTVPCEALAQVVREQVPEAAAKTRVIPDGISLPPSVSQDLPPRPQVTPLWTKEPHLFEIGWFGTRGSWRAPGGLSDLTRIAPQLEALSARWPLRLTVVSNSREMFEEISQSWNFPTRYQPWPGHAGFCAAFCSQDLCVLPISLNPYTLCKSNNRPALSLALGVPIVADAVPSYQELSPFCTLGDWSVLESYVENPERRLEALRGAAYVRQHLSVENAARAWGEALKSC